MSAANWGIFGGGGVNIFFGGRNVHQVFVGPRQTIAENIIHI